MPKSILDPGFKYVPSTQTDIRKTFARARKELARQADAVSRDGRTIIDFKTQPKVRRARQT